MIRQAQERLRSLNLYCVCQNSGDFCAFVKTMGGRGEGDVSSTASDTDSFHYL